MANKTEDGFFYVYYDAEDNFQLAAWIARFFQMLYLNCSIVKEISKNTKQNGKKFLKNTKNIPKEIPKSNGSNIYWNQNQRCQSLMVTLKIATKNNGSNVNRYH